MDMSKSRGDLVRDRPGRSVRDVAIWTALQKMEEVGVGFLECVHEGILTFFLRLNRECTQRSNDVRVIVELA